MELSKALLSDVEQSNIEAIMYFKIVNSGAG